MQFIRFGRLADDGTFHETLGTSSFYHIDGRLNTANAHRRAIAECQRRGFDGFQYYRGSSILDAKAVGYPAIVKPIVVKDSATKG